MTITGIDKRTEAAMLSVISMGEIKNNIDSIIKKNPAADKLYAPLISELQRNTMLRTSQVHILDMFRDMQLKKDQEELNEILKNPPQEKLDAIKVRDGVMPPEMLEELKKELQENLTEEIIKEFDFEEFVSFLKPDSAESVLADESVLRNRITVYFQKRSSKEGWLEDLNKRCGSSSLTIEDAKTAAKSVWRELFIARMSVDAAIKSSESVQTEQPSSTKESVDPSEQKKTEIKTVDPIVVNVDTGSPAESSGGIPSFDRPIEAVKENIRSVHHKITQMKARIAKFPESKTVDLRNRLEELLLKETNLKVQLENLENLKKNS